MQICNNTPTRTIRGPQQPQEERTTEAPDPFLDGFIQSETRVEFGQGGITMEQLAQCMKPNADGGFTLNFSGLEGVKVTRRGE